MMDLNGHEAGNGGHSQGKSKVHRVSSTRQWRQGLSFDAIVKLRDVLDEMLQRIRSERYIRPPVFKCPNCGYVGEGAEPHVSVPP